MSGTTPELIIAVESPLQGDIVALARALDAFHQGLYPAEANHHLDIEALAAPGVRFLTARRGGNLLGIGALLLREARDFGEVKRMYVQPEARGLGVAGKLLVRIEELARQSGLPVLMLETGTANLDALKVYERAGFVLRGPFGSYPAHPMSIFMEKRLRP